MLSLEIGFSIIFTIESTKFIRKFSSCGTTIPQFFRVSLLLPQSDATTGKPHARASTITVGNASLMLGKY